MPHFTGVPIWPTDGQILAIAAENEKRRQEIIKEAHAKGYHVYEIHDETVIEVPHEGDPQQHQPGE